MLTLNLTRHRLSNAESGVDVMPTANRQGHFSYSKKALPKPAVVLDPEHPSYDLVWNVRSRQARSKIEIGCALPAADHRNEAGENRALDAR